MSDAAPARSDFDPGAESLDLIHMCVNGNLVRVQRLLDNGADVNEVEGVDRLGVVFQRKCQGHRGQVFTKTYFQRIYR